MLSGYGARRASSDDERASCWLRRVGERSSSAPWTLPRSSSRSIRRGRRAACSPSRDPPLARPCCAGALGASRRVGAVDEPIEVAASPGGPLHAARVVAIRWRIPALAGAIAEIAAAGSEGDRRRRRATPEVLVLAPALEHARSPTGCRTCGRRASTPSGGSPSRSAALAAAGRRRPRHGRRHRPGAGGRGHAAALPRAGGRVRDPARTTDARSRRCAGGSTARCACSDGAPNRRRAPSGPV